MRRRTPRLRVDRLELIAELEQKRRRVDAMHAADLEHHFDALERHRGAVVRALEKALAAAAGGKLPAIAVDGTLAIPCRPQPAALPARHPDSVYLAATIVALKHGVDELVWLSRDDAAYYYGSARSTLESTP